MKRLILVFGVLGAGMFSPAADARECFATPAAVYAAHPNAAHASYTRINKPQRCWYADVFKAHAKEPTPQRLAAVTPTSRGAVAVPQTAAPARQRHEAPAAATPAADWHGDAAMSATMFVPFPSGVPPSSRFASDVQPLNRLLSAEDTPADFESRFSASGYRVRK